MRKALFAAALTASLLGGPAGRPSLFDPLFAFFSAIWDGQSFDEGCGMDPNGRCTAAPQPQLDEGCGWDPNGRCTAAPQPQLDEGCGFDPNGRCTAGS
jgi:hypothetical protein